MTQSAYHEHDCICCDYLGSKEYIYETDPKMQVDFYVCTQNSGRETVIARFGTHGDYFSSLLMLKQSANHLITQKKADEYLSAFSYMSELTTTPDIINILAEAGKRAMEGGFLDENLKYVKKARLKIVRV